MASMNAGRTAAQTSHAANYFVKEAKEAIKYLDDPKNQFTKNFKAWENETEQGYGTVIVLDGGTGEEIDKLLDKLEVDYLVGKVIDPEYAVRDGDVVHLVPNVFTCAFAFQIDSHDPELLKGLNLYG